MQIGGLENTSKYLLFKNDKKGIIAKTFIKVVIKFLKLL